MMTILLVAAATAYVLMMLVLHRGLERADRIAASHAYEPPVSIIVAARNEEEHIGRCIESIFRLEYPPKKLELIVVNDCSSDRTAEIIDRYRALHPFHALSTLPGEGILRGKTNAITCGIEASSGEILLFTDADCTVSPAWVRETVRSFDERTGIVGGFTLLQADRAFEGMQALDWIFLFGLASATAGWNIPLTVIGNNLAVRRSAYEKTGGYRKIPFSVTEDYSLVRSVLEKTSFRVRFPVNPAAVVTSRACQSWSQLFRQKQRWGVGGLDMVWPGVVIMAVAWIFRFSLLMAALTGGSLPATAASFIAMAIVDARFLGKALTAFKARRYFRHFFLFEIYFTLYTFLIPFIALASRKVVWKERTL